MPCKFYTLNEEYLGIKAESDNFTGIIIHQSFENTTFDIHFDWKAWYKNGTLHREDGPAVEYPNKRKEYWISGQKIKCNDIEAFKLYVSLLKVKNLL